MGKGLPVRWTQHGSINDVTYAEVQSALKGEGFIEVKNDSHMKRWVHPSLKDSAQFPVGYIEFNVRHRKGQKSTVYSGTIRDIVEAVGVVRDKEREENE